MKWIKNRQKFLNEAKLRDVILPKQANQLVKNWGEKYLDYDEITPTEKIKQGKWKLSESDKNFVLGAFFDTNMEDLLSIFNKLSPKFVEVINKSINTSIIRDRKDFYEVVLKDFDISSPTITQIICLYDPIFRKLDVRETIATEMILRDDSGRLIPGEDGRPQKVAKQSGEPVFSKNLINISSFVQDFNSCFPDENVKDFYNSNTIQSVKNLASEDLHKEWKTDFDIFGKDIYLSITHNPKDILNMSISKFYDSCQNLYSGCYKNQVLGNVFDPNSIPAFLVFDTKVYQNDELISEQLPLARMVIRNIESFDENSETKIFFDRCYPDRVKDEFDRIVPIYSDNVCNVSVDDDMSYLWVPDIDQSDKLDSPYMDRLKIKKSLTLGINTKSLILNRSTDWSKFKISKNNNIKEVIVETTDVPNNIYDVSLNLDWIKFKFLKINNLDQFKNLKYRFLSFDKCSLSNTALKDAIELNPNLEKLQLVACEIDNLDMSIIKNIDELQLLFTLDRDTKLSEVLKDIKVKKLTISGDVLSNKENKQFINSLKSKGLKVEIIGPII